MVVVAIASLLVAMLLPALARARQAARMVRCGSNLHQIGIATLEYSYDARDYSTVGRWALLLAPYLSGHSLSAMTTDFNDPDYAPRKMKVLQCPSTFNMFKVWGPNSYGANSYLTSVAGPSTLFKGYEHPLRLSHRVAWRQHHALPLIGESVAMSFIGDRWNATCIYEYAHDRRAGYAFADGHVEHRPKREAWFFMTAGNRATFCNRNGNEYWAPQNNKVGTHFCE